MSHGPTEPVPEPEGLLARLNLSRVPEAARAGLAEAQRALEAGASFVRSSLARLPLLASVEADIEGSGPARDETHYFLVPFRAAEGGYALYSARRVPPGYAEANALPRLRVFHLPGAGAERTLEALAIEDRARAASASAAAAGAAMDERLRSIADEIDRQSGRVTGGLLLIGGVVAIANPLLGIGIAAKALLPSVGGLLSREGLKHLAGRVKSFREARDERARRSEAAAALAQEGSVLTRVNPLLAALEEAVSGREPFIDPLVAFRFEHFALEGFDAFEMLRLSARAIDEVYSDVAPDAGAHAAARLRPETAAWLRLVRAHTARRTG